MDLEGISALLTEQGWALLESLPPYDEGEKRIPLDVKVGDTVLYSKYGGTEVKYSGEEFLILSARDVLAVIER